MNQMTQTALSALRDEITLGSLFVSDYENSFGITAKSCCDFFDGYCEFLAEKMCDENIDSDAFYENLDEYDNDENLWEWYNCFMEDPFEYEDIEEDE